MMENVVLKVPATSMDSLLKKVSEKDGTGLKSY
jgi:hypothetical protein